MSDKIGVLIVDDHVMFAETLRMYLQVRDDIQIVGIARTGAEALLMTASERPDVVLMDQNLPDQSGIAVTTQILEQSPDTRVVMLSGSTDDRAILEAIEAGSTGWVSKEESPAQVAEAVVMAHAGEVRLGSAELARLVPRLRRGRRPRHDLSPRELEVLRMMAEGLSTDAIASSLVLSPKTVRNHVQRILSKLSAHSKLEAVVIATREGIVQSSS